MMRPEQPPKAGTAQGEALQKELYGGLKGRLCHSLGALDNALEAMGDFLQASLNPTEYGKLQPMLAEMDNQLGQLRRLSEYTADAALGTALGQMYTPHLMDLLFTLDTFCRIFNEEAPLAEHRAKVRLLPASDAVVPVLGDEHMIGALLANLVSNAVAARDDCTVTLTCTPAALACRDDGPGLPAEAADLLTQGIWTNELVESGGIGLLLIRRYALTLGWKISVESPPEGGTVIRFALPPSPMGDDKMQLHSAGNLLGREKRFRALLRRDLEALPKP